MSQSVRAGDELIPYYTTHWKWGSLLLVLLFCASWGFYFYVRVRYTIPRNYVWYSWTIFGFEILASSNMFVHCLYMLKIRKYHQGEAPCCRAQHVWCIHSQDPATLLLGASVKGVDIQQTWTMMCSER